MRYRHLIFFLLVFNFVKLKSALAQEKNIGYLINGDINKLEGKIFLLKYGGSVIDSTTVKNHRFKITGHIKEPYLYALVKKNGDFLATFVLKGNPIDLSGDIKTVKISGDNEQEIDKKWIERTTIFNSRRDSLQGIISKDSLAKDKLSQVDADELDFVNHEIISKNPNKFLSLLYLKLYIRKFDVDTASKLLNSLNTTLQNQELGKLISARIAFEKHKVNNSPSNQAPLFSMNDNADNLIKLSDYRGKYVFLNFWASWCIPCRQENPSLIGIYKKLDKSKYEFISVSLDKNKADWLRAIKEDKLAWVQVRDEAGADSKVSWEYNIKSIPQNFLIDPNGNIIFSGDESVRYLESLIKL